MVRPWLVMLNSSRMALAPTAFSCIISAEICFIIIASISLSFIAEAIYNAGVIHRNFRIQVRLISAIFFLSTAARFALLYYQLFDVPLEDFDYVLIVANIIRDSSFGYLCGMIPSFAMERTLATLYWKWYERQSPDTMAALFVIELCNVVPATMNSIGWLFGLWNFTYNVVFMMLSVALGGSLFLSMYIYNRYMYHNLSITIAHYSVAKTFQIRENCRIMECLMFAGVPVCAVTGVGFSFFCYYEWGPTEWELSRYLSIALFDLFVVQFSLFFMILAVNMDSEFQRQLNNLKMIATLRRFLRLKPPVYKKSKLKSVHVKPPGIVDSTTSYFIQGTLSRDKSMTRPWMVMLNSTHIALAPNTFTLIIVAEITLSVIATICMPFVSEAIYNAGKFQKVGNVSRDETIGVIHRNFRIQVRLISAAFLISTLSRYVLLYYQLFDIPLDDNDYLLLVANITRDATFGYLCGIIPSFALERTVATIFWRWYERQAPDTMLALLFIEFTNIIPSAVNATGWILGYWPFIVNEVFWWISVTFGVILFLTTYSYNRLMFRALSVKVGQYSVAKTFQIRENCRIMECLMLVGIPLATFAAISFTLFCFYKWAPTEWILSRHISIAFFDLFIILSCIFFMMFAINMDSEFRRQFNNLKVIAFLRVLFRMKYPTYKKSRLKSAHIVQPGVEDTTQSYFNQFEAAWK